MPLSTAAAGSDLGSCAREIAVRDVLAYAAGIGDTGDAVFDDARNGGVAAPPSYCVSLEWPVVSRGRGSELLGGELDELRRGVHASQDSHFHRPIRPGDSLTTSGRYVGIRSTRAGVLLTTRLDTVDGKGRPVATSWSRSIFRGVETAGPNAETERAPEPPRLGLNGDAPGRSEIFVPREMPHVYTECARIWNPIHTEREVALAAGLPDIILHGTATWALGAAKCSAPTAAATLRGSGACTADSAQWSSPARPSSWSTRPPARRKTADARSPSGSSTRKAGKR